MPQWRFIDTSSKQCHIRAREKCFVIDDGDRIVSVSASDVAVLMVSDESQIDGSALALAGQSGCALHVCDWRGRPLLQGIGYTGHNRVMARQSAQRTMSQPRRKQAWASVVRAKILGQANVLASKNLRGETRLRRLASDVKSGDKENFEAQAARVYWRALGIQRESRMGLRGDVNSALDYGYAIARSFAMSGIVAAGLCQTTSLFHRSARNPWPLADDLMEPLRPGVDVVALRCMPIDLECPEDKKEFVGALLGTAFINGKSLASSAKSLCLKFGVYCESDNKKMEVGNWEDTVINGD